MPLRSPEALERLGAQRLEDVRLPQAPFAQRVVGLREAVVRLRAQDLIELGKDGATVALLDERFDAPGPRTVFGR